jgi:hypothetical protein
MLEARLEAVVKAAEAGTADWILSYLWCPSLMFIREESSLVALITPLHGGRALFILMRLTGMRIPPRYDLDEEPAWLHTPQVFRPLGQKRRYYPWGETDIQIEANHR